MESIITQLSIIFSIMFVVLVIFGQYKTSIIPFLILTVIITVVYWKTLLIIVGLGLLYLAFTLLGELYRQYTN